MRNKITYLFVLFAAAAIYSCVAGKKVQEETTAVSGFILWKQNCVRCHNVPSPAAYSDEQWDIIGTHMRLRANLTKKETEEIIRFLQTIN